MFLVCILQINSYDFYQFSNTDNLIISDQNIQNLFWEYIQENDFRNKNVLITVDEIVDFAKFVEVVIIREINFKSLLMSWYR